MIWLDRKVVENCQQPVFTWVWSPDTCVLVLGNSNDVDDFCYQEKCVELGIPILKRKGGGGAVLLHQHCIIISSGIWVERYFHNSFYFQLLNNTVIEVLSDCSNIFAKLEHKGISDIAYHDRKVAGTSMFRSRNYLLYQASILYHTEIEKIEQVLKQPKIEPSYRQKRSHRDFLNCLSDIAPQVSMAEIKTKLQKDLPLVLQKNFAKEIIDPPHDQCEYLLRRVR